MFLKEKLDDKEEQRKQSCNYMQTKVSRLMQTPSLKTATATTTLLCVDINAVQCFLEGVLFFNLRIKWNQKNLFNL